MYCEDVNLNGNAKEDVALVQQKIPESSIDGINKVTPLVILAAGVIANAIAKEPFAVKKEILTSIGSMDIQRIVMNQIIVKDNYTKELVSFYLNHNDYYLAYLHTDPEAKLFPSSYLLLAAYHGPDYIIRTVVDDLAISYKVIVCKL